MLLKTKLVDENFIQVEFPKETLERIGIFAGDELEIHDYKDSLIVCSAKKISRKNEILNAAKEIIENRLSALEELK